MPTPWTIGAPTGVGGIGSNGSFHWNTNVLPAANCDRLRDVDAPLPALKSWKPPAYSSGGTFAKLRFVPAHDAATPGTMRTLES